MPRLTNARLVSQRLRDEWKLLASVFVGVLIAVTISVGSNVYLHALEQLAFRVSLNQVKAPLLNLTIFAKRIPLTTESVARMDNLVSTISNARLGDLYAGHEIYLRGPSAIVGTDELPLPAIGDQDSFPMVWDGYFQVLTNVESHAVYLQGRAPAAQASETEGGFTVEVAISEQVADETKFGPGDSVQVAVDVFTPVRITANIVGVFQADDLKDEYWSTAALILASQSKVAQGGAESGFPPPDGVQWDDRQGLAIGLFVPMTVMTEVIGPANRGGLANPVVFGKIDKERLGQRTASSFVKRLDLLQEDILNEIPGATVSSGTVLGLIVNVGRRVFFSRIPLLLLLTIMVVTALFYMTMMVSYLAKSRERDASLMRSRGVAMSRLLTLYGLEGVALCAAAVALGPVIALASVACMGLLPPFREITGGEFLLARIDAMSIATGAGVSLLCLALYVTFGAAGARSGLLAQKARAARPATVSFFHRFYIDLALVALGGLVFWELQSREQIVSSGLFTELQVNETLLFGPILFLIVVALLFMRLFPLFVRYVSGESPALVNLLAGASSLPLAGGALYFGYRDALLSEALAPALFAFAAGAAYYVTRQFFARKWWWGAFIVLALTAAYALTADLSVERALFPFQVALLAVVPALALFEVFRLVNRSAPSWLSISLLHMARNPLQYTWLVLLLVLVTGLGIFATTVGGTLTRSQQEQVQFETPTDMRIQGRPLFLSRGLRGMRDDYTSTPAIDRGVLAYRTSASIGNVSMQLLALEPEAFAEISWFRDDFADVEPEDFMSTISMSEGFEGLPLPDGATSVGLWLKPIERQPLMSVWVVVQDAAGAVRTVSLGEVGDLAWHRVSAALPEGLEHPLKLLAVSLYEPGTSTQTSGGGTPGTVLFDEVHAILADGEQRAIEGFEGENVWAPIPTDFISSDVFFTTNEDARFGERSAVFTFGSNRNRAVRGIYGAGDRGVIPVVVSRSVADSTGLRLGAAPVVSVSGWLVPIEVVGVIDLFPTLNTASSGFLLADIRPLLTYMNMMSQLSTVEPNELYLRKTGEAPDIIEEIAEELRSLLLKVTDSTASLEEIRRDPLQNAGWRALVVIALTVALLAAVFGYVAYMLLFGENSEREMAFLQSLGLSRAQLFGLLAFEHLTIVALGLGVGAWAGFQMSRLMVGPLAVSDVGQSIVPPFILVTDWSMMLPAYAVTLSIFGGVLFTLYRSLGKAKLFELARNAND